MNNIYISIVIATYNASSTLFDCLSSIASQKNKYCELIIIDGFSSDKTIEIINSFDWLIDYYVSEPDLGVYDAWNKGIKYSKGSWIMFIGADDILLPNTIEIYLNTIFTNLSNTKIDYICGKNEFIDKNGKILKIIGSAPNWKNMRLINVTAHVASLHNKNNLFNNIGYFNLDYKICADYELLLRKSDSLNFIFLPVVLARMKIGGISFTYKAILETFYIRSKHSNISSILNFFILVTNFIAFYLFKLRNQITE